ncbi:hypothetical protein HQ584_13210, partial [Patescibacteria group bacterium]|nr:hypothetical protein [Patescibacteria group bacterium]
MQDIINSLNRAFANQGWAYAERLHRIGNPFVWVDADQTSKMNIVRGAQAFLQYLTMFYEQYPIPKEIRTGDYDEMKRYIEDRLRRAYRYFLPFLGTRGADFEKSIECTAIVRAQDYCALRTFCDNLKKPAKHLD